MPTKYVLIADADQKVVLKLEEALEDLDLQISIASDGAQALERALSVRHDLFLFGDTMPVVDTVKLVEILRNNPRTAGVPVVLMRKEPGPAGYADGTLPKPITRQAAIDAVLRFAFKIGNVGKGGGDLLAGSLGEIPLADLLQIMLANKREGVIELRNGALGSIWVREGEVVDARMEKSEGLKALLRMFRLDEGQFTFKASKVLRAAAIGMPLDALLVEAARQQDEIARLVAERPLNGRLVLLRELSSLPEGMHPVHRELLLLIEFYGDVEAVVDNAKCSDLEAHAGLRSLVDAGMIGAATEESVQRSEGLRLEPGLIVHLKKEAQHSPRRPRPVRVAVFATTAEVVAGCHAMLPGAQWSRHPDRVLGNRIQTILDGEFALAVDFYPPGEAFTSLGDLPDGLLVGGLVVAGAHDDIELDFLNESAAWLQARGLPVEYAYLGGGGDGAAEWIRNAFGLGGEPTVYTVERNDYGPLLDALRALLVRAAVSGGWTVSAR
jgi:CheY-like chemotaxis protein